MKWAFLSKLVSHKNENKHNLLSFIVHLFVLKIKAFDTAGRCNKIELVHLVHSKLNKNSRYKFYLKHLKLGQLILLVNPN